MHGSARSKLSRLLATAALSAAPAATALAALPPVTVHLSGAPIQQASTVTSRGLIVSLVATGAARWSLRATIPAPVARGLGIARRGSGAPVGIARAAGRISGPGAVFAQLRLTRAARRVLATGLPGALRVRVDGVAVAGGRRVGLHRLVLVRR